MSWIDTCEELLWPLLQWLYLEGILLLHLLLTFGHFTTDRKTTHHLLDFGTPDLMIHLLNNIIINGL